jgi:hypothetical protein
VHTAWCVLGACRPGQLRRSAAVADRRGTHRHIGNAHPRGSQFGGAAVNGAIDTGVL